MFPFNPFRSVPGSTGMFGRIDIGHVREEQSVISSSEGSGKNALRLSVSVFGLGIFQF